MNEQNIITQLKNLKNEHRPDSGWVQSERALIMQKINAYTEDQHVYFKWNLHVRWQATVISVFAFALVFSGTSVLSKDALPGSPLYAIKELKRSAQTITASGERRIELEFSFVSEKTTELASLINQTEKSEEELESFKKAVTSVSKNATSLRSQLEKVDQGEDAVKAAQKVTLQTSDIIEQLDSFAVSVPEMALAVAETKDSLYQADIKALEVVVESLSQEGERSEEMKNLVEERIKTIVDDAADLGNQLALDEENLSQVKEHIAQAQESVVTGDYKAAVGSVYLMRNILTSAEKQLLHQSNGMIIENKDGLGEVKGIKTTEETNEQKDDSDTTEEAQEVVETEEDTPQPIEQIQEESKEQIDDLYDLDEDTIFTIGE